MRDISFKVSTLRTARARAELTVSSISISAIREKKVPKGDPLEIAKAAAIIAAKKTTEWIPYCHNIPIEFVGVEYEIQENRLVVDVCVKTVAKTGVEMEAMTAASAAALTLYDMLKMLDDDMEITSIRLLEKRGGKSDFILDREWNAAVLTISDRASSGEYSDLSGPILVQGLNERGASVVQSKVIPDDLELIQASVSSWVIAGVKIIFTTGGTGIGPRDITVDAVKSLLDFELPGVVEAFRSYGQVRIHGAMLSRSVAGVIGQTIVVCLPGSPAACEDALNALFPALLHGMEMLKGTGHA